MANYLTDLNIQKTTFFNTAKGKKALSYCYSLFKDFVGSKTEPAFLKYFYAQEKYNDNVPLSAQNEFNDYELLFWFWFYKRLERAQIEHEIYLSNAEYEKIKKELEESNPINAIGNAIQGIISNASLVPIFIGAGFFIYYAFKKK